MHSGGGGRRVKLHIAGTSKVDRVEVVMLVLSILGLVSPCLGVVLICIALITGGKN